HVWLAVGLRESELEVRLIEGFVRATPMPQDAILEAAGYVERFSGQERDDVLLQRRRHAIETEGFAIAGLVENERELDILTTRHGRIGSAERFKLCGQSFRIWRLIFLSTLDCRAPGEQQRCKRRPSRFTHSVPPLPMDQF